MESMILWASFGERPVTETRLVSHLLNRCGFLSQGASASGRN
jgi:hypothetical protein